MRRPRLPLASLGTIALLLVIASCWQWWQAHDAAIRPGTAPVRQAAPPPGERLLEHKNVVRRWADNDAFDDLWIYGDLELGFEEAQRTGKPLLVTYRCVP